MTTLSLFSYYADPDNSIFSMVSVNSPRKSAVLWNMLTRRVFSLTAGNPIAPDESA
jgi:hypothetical protein